MNASRMVAGKYLLGPLLGKGGSGEVYRALQIDLDRDVALKLLVGGDRDPDARTRFLREARVGAEIHHPCVAQVFDAGVTEDGTHYFAMELLEGETLAKRLDRTGPMEPGEAVAIVAGLCLALETVHAKGILHRDLKPSNVFLSRRQDGGSDPKLIDFGIAKRIPVSAEMRRRVTTARGLGSPAATALDIIVGTPRYLSPEQILGERLDARSDVYGLAVTLYEALAGTPPFELEEFSELASSIVLEPAQPLADRVPSRQVPAALDREILRALSKKPEARPASAAEFAAALWSALAEARHSPSPRPAPPPPQEPRRALAIPIVACVLFLLALVTVFALRGGPPRAAAPAPSATIAAAAPLPASSDPGTGEPTSASADPAPTARPEARAKAPRSPRSAGRPAPAASSVTPAAAAAAGYRIDDLKTPY
jgi:eukaryotic-like serine/threonine-protein kinase